jgi:catechol 2,3-dioxygenase-like lactoylglutathione lyase family enzyme
MEAARDDAGGLSSERLDVPSTQAELLGRGGNMDPRQEHVPAPREGFLMTHFITSRDVKRSVAFYRDVLGGQVVFEGEPSAVKLANGWIIINVGGGPTDDKPDVILEPPRDPHRTSSFLNLRVADIRAVYDEWRRRGAEFLTPPKQHATEIRCYMRDPDGYLIEVGQTTAL